MREVIHFLYCPFTGLGLHGGYRGDEWLKNRIQIFKQYTLPSLLNQTNTNFTLWVSWRPEDVNNPIVEGFGDHLEKIEGLNTFFTYGGTCFWDDKYKDDDLLERLKVTLPHISEAMNFLPYANTILMTIQPSDDMYISTAVEDIQAAFDDGKYEAAGFYKGYIMDYSTKEISEYNPKTWPPFFTIKFDREVFTDPQRHYDYTGPYETHEYLSLNKIKIPGRGYVVGAHGANISTYYDHPFKGKEVEAEPILLDTGTLYSDPIIIKKGFRLAVRKYLNLLPFNHKLHYIYHLLPKKCQVL